MAGPEYNNPSEIARSLVRKFADRVRSIGASVVGSSTTTANNEPSLVVIMEGYLDGRMGSSESIAAQKRSQRVDYTAAAAAARRAIQHSN